MPLIYSFLSACLSAYLPACLHASYPIARDTPFDPSFGRLLFTRETTPEPVAAVAPESIAPFPQLNSYSLRCNFSMPADDHRGLWTVRGSWAIRRMRRGEEKRREDGGDGDGNGTVCVYSIV